MEFKFPNNIAKVSVNLRIDSAVNNKVRRLAEKHNCMITDVYMTIIGEAIEEYEAKFGIIEEKKDKPHYLASESDFLINHNIEEDERVVIEKVPPVRIAEPTIDIEDEKAKIATDNGWIKYPRCEGCGTTTKKRFSGPLCHTCYFKKRGRDNHEEGRKVAFNKKPEVLIKIKTDSKWQYCNSITCPDRGLLWKTEKMINDNGHYYCSEKCRDANKVTELF